MSDWKIKVTFADGSKRVLKHPAELGNANKRREIRLVLESGKVLDTHISSFKDGVVTLADNGMFPTEIEGAKVMGWCYRHHRKNSK